MFKILSSKQTHPKSLKAKKVKIDLMIIPTHEKQLLLSFYSEKMLSQEKENTLSLRGTW
jgi:hypothetical protein